MLIDAMNLKDDNGLSLDAIGVFAPSMGWAHRNVDRKVPALFLYRSAVSLTAATELEKAELWKREPDGGYRFTELAMTYVRAEEGE